MWQKRAGPCEWMTNLRPNLLQHIGPTCERALVCASIRGSGRCGPFEFALAFKSRAVAEAIEPLFPTTSGGNHDLTIAFLSRRDLDLTGLIPEPADISHALMTSGGYYAAWRPDERPVLYLLDKQARRGLVWFAADVPPNWELSRPALPLINMLSVDTTWTLAHGGAVGKDGRFLLFAGRGRSGKSTAALACARTGWDYAGDDYIITEPEKCRVEPLYTSARLRIDVVDAFSDLVARTSSGITTDKGDSRHELRLGAQFKDQIRGGTIAAILLPRRQGSPVPTFAPARKCDAFAALMSVAGTLLPWSRQVLVARLADLVGCAPTFFVDTGSNPALLPDEFGRLLGGLRP